MNKAPCFTAFKKSTKGYSLPERFTFPFCYEPHPLCLLATEELQQQLQSLPKFQQEFDQVGKMFGVLLVANEQGELGYLSAFSGRLANSHSYFVPAVFDLDAQTDFFHAENLIINRLNSEVEQLMSAPELLASEHQLTKLLAQQKTSLEQHQGVMADNRKIRKAKRTQIRDKLLASELALSLKALAKESVADKNQLKKLKSHWNELIAQAQQQLTVLTDKINDLKNKRKRLSTRLQKKLFRQYRLLNSAGIEKDLLEVFQATPFPIPPAGTGDCAAPKLLQYAFQHKLKPLAMAEFWWGKAPKSALRQHKNFYPACSGKCQPILTHMLAGMDVDENPLLVNPALGKELPIVYQDEYLVVVNKPNEFLSVPGKNIEDSVYLRIKQQFPQATGSLIVHRLDMSTSGLMVLALTKRVQKNLQQQFINRTIKKRYLAVLEGDIEKLHANTQGEINLPLRGDLDDRPRQLVCFEQGKPSKTLWQVIRSVDGKSKLYLYPETGRTHQLRVHCAHPQGLNMPILGDDLYGHNNYSDEEAKKFQRLHLHAQNLTLCHPITKQVMTFNVECEF